MFTFSSTITFEVDWMLWIVISRVENNYNVSHMIYNYNKGQKNFSPYLYMNE
jgi:hypothetical protein